MTDRETIDTPDTPAPMRKREWVWLLVTAGGLLAMYASPLREHLTHAETIKADLEQLGWIAPVVFVLVMTLTTAMGLPRMLLYPVGGLAFGIAAGLGLNMLGTLGGAFLAFGYARWAGRELMVQKWPRLANALRLLDGRGIATVALLRQLPNPGHLTNLVFGLSTISPMAFVVGTALGCLPSAIPATLIGSSVSASSPRIRMALIGCSLMFIVLIWAGFTLLVRRSSLWDSMRAVWQPIAKINPAGREPGGTLQPVEPD